MCNVPKEPNHVPKCFADWYGQSRSAVNLLSLIVDLNCSFTSEFAQSQQKNLHPVSRTKGMTSRTCAARTSVRYDHQSEPQWIKSHASSRGAVCWMGIYLLPAGSHKKENKHRAGPFFSPDVLYEPSRTAFGRQLPRPSQPTGLNDAEFVGAQLS